MFNRMRSIKASLTPLVLSSIIAGLVFFYPGLAEASVIQDINLSSDYAKDAILELAEKNIVAGDEHGNFNPHQTVTRAQMVTMIVNALEVDTTNISDTATFEDVPETDWSYKYIEAAYREGIIKGISEEEFGKNQHCTREQMIVMFVRSLGFSDENINSNEQLTHVKELTDKDMISDWAQNSVEFSLASGLIKGTSDTTFAPKGHALREQVAVVTQRLVNDKENILELANNTSETVQDPNHETENTDSDNASEAIKHPDLYDALKENEEYRGEFSIDSSINFYGETPEEAMSFTVIGTGAVNGDDSQIKLIMSMNAADMTLPDIVIEAITVDGKSYVKEPELNTWIDASSEDIEGDTIFGFTPDELNQMNKEFFNIYNDLPIEKVGNVEIDGINATKYILTLDNKAIKEFLPSGFLEENIELGVLYDEMELDLEIQIYLNEQNQIIKEVFNYTGKILTEEETSFFDMLIDIAFTNIGEDIEIVAPEIDGIEVAPEEAENIG